MVRDVFTCCHPKRSWVFRRFADSPVLSRSLTQWRDRIEGPRRRFGSFFLAVLIPCATAYGWTGNVMAGETERPAPGHEKRLWVIPPMASTDTCSSESRRIVCVDSHPTGAEVSRGGERVGVTPLWFEVCPSGGETLRVYYPGYLPELVKPGSDRGGVTEVRLRPDESDVQLLRLEGSRKGGSRLRARALRFGLAFVGTGSAALGFHFKGRADDAYEEYLHTGHAGRMQERFDRAEEYDRYVLGCWIVAELSVVGLLYLLVRAPEADRWTIHAAAGGAAGECVLGARLRF